MNKNFININYVKNLDLIWMIFKRIFIIKFSPWINIVRFHPQIIKEYDDNFQYENKKYKNFNYKRILNYIFENPKINFIKIKKKKIDILIISHLINKENYNIADDFYFKNLQKIFEKKGLSSLIILRNITQINSKLLINKKNMSFNNNKILLPLRSPLLFELYYICNVLFYIIYISFFGFKIKDKKIKKIFYNITKFKILKKSISNLRLYYQFNTILKYYKPETVITTFEGHAWERVIYNICNKKNIKTIGYQFSILIKNQFSIFKDFGFHSNPRAIYTSSKINQKIIKNNLKYKIKELGLLGYNSQSREIKKNNFSRKNNIFLLIPEGINSETFLFYKLAIKLLTLRTDIKIIFRCHSQLSFEKFISENNLKYKFNSNLIISNESLENDIAKSKYCIYRGTSAIIKAVSSGCIPIYFNAKQNININPLFHVEDKINTIDVPEDLNLLYLSNGLKLDKKVFNFSKDYFAEFNAEKLINYIKNDKHI